jgi:hypothetical protein
VERWREITQQRVRTSVSALILSSFLSIATVSADCFESCVRVCDAEACAHAIAAHVDLLLKLRHIAFRLQRERNEIEHWRSHD